MLTTKMDDKVCWDIMALSQFSHLPLDKMAAIFAGDIFRCIFVNEKFCIFIKISPKFVPKDQVDSKPII